MSAEDSQSEHSPKEYEKMLANFIAGTVVALFSTLKGIFSLIFGFLAALAG